MFQSPTAPRPDGPGMIGVVGSPHSVTQVHIHRQRQPSQADMHQQLVQVIIARCEMPTFCVLCQAVVHRSREALTSRVRFQFNILVGSAYQSR